jgi:hypothetical protein
MHSQTSQVNQHDQMLIKQSSDLVHKINTCSQTPLQIQANRRNPDEKKSKK